MTQELEPIKGQGLLWGLGLVIIIIGIGLFFSSKMKIENRQNNGGVLTPSTKSSSLELKQIELKNNLFDSITGKPSVWYYRDEDGLYEFYDRPGYHPATGKALQPINRQVLSEWETFKEHQAEIIRQRNAEATRIEALRRAEEAKKAREKWLVELRSMIDTSKLSKDTSNVGLVIMSSDATGDLAQLPKKILPNLLKSNVVSYNLVSDYFKEDFKRKGYFAKIFNGDVKLLEEMKALSHVDYVFLGKVKYSFASGVVEGIVSCNIDFAYKIINKAGSLVDSGTVSAVGPGHTKEGALRRGLERLVEEDGNIILKKFSTH